MTRLNVLYVDDDADIRAIAEMALGLDPDTDVTAYGSAGEALDYLESGMAPPDVILLDVKMPHMDGPTLAGAIRRLPGMARVPIVFMTARARACEIENYSALGIAGVIAKPFDPMNLAGEIRRRLIGRTGTRTNADT